ncbi:MAG: hypothetical protein ABEJ82_09330 [Haloplanus sp.]
MVGTETYTIEGPDGDTDTLELPAGLTSKLADEGEDPTTVVAEVGLLSFAQRSHAFVHHSQGEVPDDLREINDKMEELFEERFGMTFGEATGHQH